MFDYPVNLTPDDGTVLVTFVDVPEAITFGRNASQSIELVNVQRYTQYLFACTAHSEI